MATKLYSPGRLKLKVKAATEAPTSATPGSNGDIIVVTDYVIAGYAISPFDIVTYMDGLVLFNYDSTLVDTINIASADGIYLGLNGCKQYISGKWHRVSAYIRVDSTWVQFSTVWNGELYAYGNEWPVITGGWGKHNYAQGNLPTTNVYIESDMLKLDAPAEDTYPVVGTARKIDLVGYERLYATVNVVQNPGNLRLMATTQQNDVESHVIVQKQGFDGTGMRTISIDVSAIDYAYICISAYGSRSWGATACDLHKIWLE